MTLVFVSHSGRDGPPDPDPDEESRRVRMRAVRDATVAALRGRHRVWLDRERLAPGTDWDNAINCGLTASDFGVLLLDRETISAPGYVFKEAVLLAHRRHEDPEFRFVTVELDGEVGSMLADNGAWRSVHLRRWQSLDASAMDPAEIASRIAGWCAEHSGRGRREVDRSAAYLGDLLRALHGAHAFSLADLVRDLTLFDSPYDRADLAEPRHLRICSHQVGARLLATPVQELPEILERLPPTVERRDLGDRLAANWVPLEVAAAVRAASDRADEGIGRQAVGMTGPWDAVVSVSLMARDLIDRGRRADLPFANFELITPLEMMEEAVGEGAEPLAAWIERQIWDGIPEHADPRAKLTRLRRRRPHVVLRAASETEFAIVDEAVTMLVTKRKTTRHVTFVLLVEPGLTDGPAVTDPVANCWIHRDDVLFAAALPHQPSREQGVPR